MAHLCSIVLDCIVIIIKRGEGGGVSKAMILNKAYNIKYLEF